CSFLRPVGVRALAPRPLIKSCFPNAQRSSASAEEKVYGANGSSIKEVLSAFFRQLPGPRLVLPAAPLWHERSPSRRSRWGQNRNERTPCYNWHAPGS